MAAAYAAEHSRPRPLSFEEQQRVMQAEYAARMQRRSMPPRCNPITILILVLALGMTFIGITMTLIAHWPGATSIGDNPLRIAGPVLFAVGGVLVIVSIFAVAAYSYIERDRWDKKLRHLMAQQINTPRDPLISGDTNKSTGHSTTASSGYTNPEFDPRRLRSGERSVDTRPDPSAAGQRSKGHDVSGDGDGDTEMGGGAVPVPVRVTKKRRSARTASELSASDVSLGSGDLGGPGMTSTLRQGGGPPVYANLSYEADTPEAELRRKPRRREEEGNGRRRRQGPPPADPIRDPVMRNMAEQQRQLRVHIKAQPGTAVHITPTATPPHRQGPAYHARPPTAAAAYPARTSAAESETEI